MTVRASPAQPHTRTAIVIGSSIAGLIAGRVLSEHFDRVTIFDRDKLPSGPELRKGVPQAAHAHAMLSMGESIISQFFPGLFEDLIAMGAVRVDMSLDARWYHFGGWKHRFPSGVTHFHQSRALLEWKIRSRLLANSNVQFFDGCVVEKPKVTADRQRITGVVFRRQGSTTEEELSADLVVDASGRGSRSPTWFEALGYSRPEETVVKVDVGYASRIYRRGADGLKDWKFLAIFPKPPHGKYRWGGIYPLEGDRWIVTLGSWCGDHPPGDEAGFLDFARSLHPSDLYRQIVDAEPLSTIALHKFPSCFRRHYERMPRVPEGYVVLGDAICSFNPIYGQGMTMSAIQARLLDELLREQRRMHGDSLAGFSRRFFERSAQKIDIPWLLSSSEDFRFTGVEGARPPGLAVLHWYMGHVHKATMHDPEIFARFLRVVDLRAHPVSLFHPRVIGRLLRGAVP